ncbi:MAG: hypothetical protein NT166_05580 [Candidatus Aminicenantes bacterium]|nr:hypothetical protein [Candidatus Aminicenantes bacterium]
MSESKLNLTCKPLTTAHESAGFKIAAQSSKAKFIVRYEFRRDSTKFGND